MATWLMLLIVPIHMALQNGGHSCLLHHCTVILEIGLIYKHAMIVFQLHCQEPSQKIAAIQKSEGLLNRDCPQTYGSDHLQYQDYLDGAVVGRILSALLRRQISSHMIDPLMDVANKMPGSPFCHPLFNEKLHVLLISFNQLEVKTVGQSYITCLSPVGFVRVVTHLQFMPCTVVLHGDITGPGNFKSFIRRRRSGR